MELQVCSVGASLVEGMSPVYVCIALCLRQMPYMCMFVPDSLIKLKTFLLVID